MKYCPVCKETFDDSLSFCIKDGEVLEEDLSSLVGTALDGQYQIEAVLGKGGMGAVYRARHILLGDRVAIKVLPPEMRSNTEWLRRFQREGQAARRFRHPNAVTVYDLRTSSDGTIYLVMEYVEGNTLDAELRKHGRFAAAEALAVLDPIMSVLNAAHAMGVVHRDLKPENIMIGKARTGGEPIVKLLDLGIAKLKEVAGAEKTGNTNLTIAGQMLGTPYYMSPEQWGELPRDGSSEIDGRADIYSLGLVFYELIAGKKPFGGLTLSELRREHVHIKPTPLHAVVANVPQGFSDAIARSIAKDRSERQETTGELANELKAALAAAGVAPSMPLPSASPAIGAVATESRGALTGAERTAPTVVGEAVVTGVESDDGIAASAGVPGQAATMPTVVVSAEELAARAAAARASESAKVISSQPAGGLTPARGRSPLLFVGAGIVVLLLIVGVGGFAVMHYMNGANANSNANGSNHNSDSSSGKSTTDLSAGAHEVARYWLEVDTPDKFDAVRAGDSVTMQSGQSFKFHLSPSENGFVYIIGPGANNAPMTFLTAQPSAGSGLKTNEARSGLDFAFPADANKKANFITLDKTPGTDEFTIVFAPNPITAPAFLAGAPAHLLTPDEQRQWSDFRAQFKANVVGTEVIKTGAPPFVSVKVPQTVDEGAPVIFQVRIEHK
ncbi:MAG TPA: serine/threonine-protein kinase [Pyrinomonadaceae bacterium]|nr:serine/threonine-protein kinase [Pyrinomonadaceae bacterium]